MGEKKVGHTGTLDPFASGVLPVCIGKATKLSEYVMASDKTYLAELRLGFESDTQDTQGRIIASSDKTDACEDEFVSAASCFIGQQRQKTPLYSAAKVDGRKLYQYAHAGTKVERPTRLVTIREIRLIQKMQRGRFLFTVRCSKGTYIRTLCSDIGKKMGSVAYLSFLLRVSSGGLDIDSALTMEEIKKCFQEGALELIPMDVLLYSLAELRVGGEWLPVIKNGGGIPTDSKQPGIMRLYCGDQFVALATADAGMIRIKSLLI